jgi:hypothetical protein
MPPAKPKNFASFVGKKTKNPPMADPNDLDKELTEIALQRLTGNDRYAVLEAASRLRRWREWHATIERPIGLI